MTFREIVTFIFIACAAATSFAQEIAGVGEMKIGMSVEEFLDLPLIKAKKLQDKAAKKYNSDESSIWETNAASRVETYQRVYSADIVKYEFKAPMGVPDFQWNDSYGVSTKFYKGKLAQVIVFKTGMEFEKILTEKYGKPIKEAKMKTVTCQNSYGAKSSYREGSESSIWGKGKKVTATFLYVVDDCGTGSSSYYVEEGAIVKVMDRINENGRKAEEAEEAKIKASASKL